MMENLAALKSFLTILIWVLGVQLVLGFRGAVFEHAQQSYATSGEPDDIIRANLDYYKMATKVAKTKGADVIVFPEYGIFPPSSRNELKKFLEYVPDPKVAPFNPCEESATYANRTILYTLSCLARDNKIIIVANLGDIQSCIGQKGCPKDGVFQFNTNVAFNRDGTALAKYHKEHLFEEFGMDLPPLGKQDPTFQTDIGLFATFVCFDIIFQRITEVAHWKGIDAVLFPTMWVDSGPLYNAIHHFQAWAVGNNVTVLAANQHVPGISSIGSGIIKGREGALVYTFNPDGHSKLLVADIGKISHRPELKSSIYIITPNASQEWRDDGKDVGESCSRKVLKPVKDVYTDYRCEERDLTNFTLVKLTKKEDSVQACDKGVCCSLVYSATDMKGNFYLGVNNGTFNALNRYFFAEEVCFLARCDDFRNKSCVTFPMRSKTWFNQVHLKANFSTNFIYPTVMSSRMRLVPRNQWAFLSNKSSSSINFFNRSGGELIMVGLKGRPYDRDPPYVR